MAGWLQRRPVKLWSLQKMLIILACFAGILLGLIFNVAILPPVILAGAAGYAVSSAGQSPGTIILAIVLLAVAVQAGYVIGLTGRDLFSQLLVRLHLVQSKRV
jgi:hypothetical protein